MKLPSFAYTLMVLVLVFGSQLFAQNSMIGDGFGGREWYVPHNYQVGAYAAYTVCGPNRQLFAWGGNNSGELGNGTTVSSTVPVAVVGMTDVKFYTTGYISAVIRQDSTAWVWGYPNHGFNLLPVQLLSGVKFVDGSITNIVFVKHDGTVWVAGRNYSGQLGNGQVSSSTTPTPVQIAGITNAVRAISVYNATIILLNDGTVKITGGKDIYQSPNSTVPVPLPGLSNIVDIKGNSRAAFALDSSGNVFAFGNGENFLGLGPIGNDTVIPPTKINFPAGAASIVALSSNCDGLSTFALDSNHNVYGWGSNFHGELGIGSNTAVLSPVLVATHAKDIFAGETFSYILKDDNSLWGTGWSAFDGNIWMNLPNIPRNVFTMMDPTVAPMNLCAPEVFGVVPVKLIEFTCRQSGDAAMINWTSAEEINVIKYILEYAEDGVSFRPIANFAAKGSNSRYDYLHQPSGVSAFYRLRIIDQDGSFTFSEIKVLKFNKSSDVVVAPNPTRHHIRVIARNNQPAKSLRIISADGRRAMNVVNANFGQDIDLSRLSAGIYTLEITFKNGQVEYCRLMKY